MLRWVWLTMCVFALKAWGQEPVWLFGAEGIRFPEEVAAYRQGGMTLLWVRVPYRDGMDFSDYDALLDEADKAGVPYLLALDLRPSPVLRQNLRCAPHDPGYVAWLHQWLDRVIPHFRHRRNLLGYALGREVDEAISYDDEGFALFLQRYYGSLEVMSKAWRVQVDSWRVSQLTAMQADDQQSPLQYGRPSLDVALYRWATLQNLLTLWAREVRARDPNPQHWLFAGPLTTYRSLAVVPPDYQGIIPFLSPERVESDWVTHNCHAVAIARRGGRFFVLPMLTVRLNDGRIIAPEALLRWTMAAIAMGAKGVVFNDWDAINETPVLRDNLAALTKLVQQEIPPTANPLTKTAILYTPFAEGAMTPQGFPLYGFALLPGGVAAPLRLAWDEPASLFFALRFHAWGTTDVLTPMELTPEFLRRYQTMFAPVAVYLEPTMQANLAAFVANGGVVVADLGLGAAQSEVPFQTFPPALQELFGLTVIRRLVVGPSVRTNMVVVRPHPLFPHLPQGFELGNAVGAFGPVLGLMPAARAHYWALLTVARTGKRIVKQEGETKVLPGVPERAAALINAYGRGYALFASTFLWAMWSPRDVGFDLFHGALIEKGATLRIANSPFAPAVWVSETDKGILVVNPTNEPQVVQLHWRTPIYCAFAGATVRPVTVTPLMQSITVKVAPNDWLFLRPVATFSAPVEASVQIIGEQLRLQLSAAPTKMVTVRIWDIPTGRRTQPWQARIEHGGTVQERKLQSDQWGVFVLPDVPTPATVMID
ncbi:MAG: hypothetical protein IMHGJWDQ_001376 [Candidatus Fervidibacter sp.]